MNFTNHDDTDEMLRRAGTGDSDAVQILFDQHRSRLKRMIHVHMDRRLVDRVDPSDIVQETLMTAHKKLDRYLAERPVAFFPWLRKIAWERLIDLQRRHIVSARRSVKREVAAPWPLPDESRTELVEQLYRSETGPLQRLAKRELFERVDDALDRLKETDREVLVLRLLEQLTVRETAHAIGISEDAVKQRQVRALIRIRQLLDQ